MSLFNKFLFFILFSGSLQGFSISSFSWIFLSVYYDENIKSGANIRFENISSCLNSSNVKIICFHDLFCSNTLVIRRFWNGNYKRQIAGVLIQVLFRDRVVHFDHFPLLKMKKHYYLMHDVASLYPGVRRSGRLRAKLFNYFIKRQKDIITVSNTTKSNLIDLGICVDRIFVSYNSTSYIGHSFGNYHHKYDCCIITTGAKHKKDNLLLDALINLDSRICLISSNKEFLECYSWRANITTMHRASEESKALALNESKYYITLSQFEGFGITVLEALYCKCVCLVSNLSVFKELFGSSKNVYFIDINENIDSQLNCLMSEDRVFLDENLMFPTWETIAAELDRYLQSV